MNLAEWMKSSDYRPSTIRSTLRHIDTARGLDELPEYMLPSFRRYLAWVESVGQDTALVLEPDGGEFYSKLCSLDIDPSTGHGNRPKVRKTERRSFDDESWRMLAVTIRGDDSDEAAVLAVMLGGLRISDVLPLTLRQVSSGASGRVSLERKGGATTTVMTAGAEKDWDALRVRMIDQQNVLATTVAEFLTKTPGASTISGDAAYQRVRRRLRQIGERLALEGPVHLHRLRRTRAIQALRVTNDPTAVQQLLGHRSIQSTYHYLDESREDDVAALQRKVAEFDTTRSKKP